MRKWLHRALMNSLYIYAVTGLNAQETWPDKMLRDMECLKHLGLIQGTVVDVQRGDAHFAPYWRQTVVGKTASIRWNGDFVEGRGKISINVVRNCIPHATFQKAR